MPVTALLGKCGMKSILQPSVSTLAMPQHHQRMPSQAGGQEASSVPDNQEVRTAECVINSMEIEAQTEGQW